MQVVVEEVRKLEVFEGGLGDKVEGGMAVE